MRKDGAEVGVAAKAAKVRVQPNRKVVVDWPPAAGISVVKPREVTAPYVVPERATDPHAPKRSSPPVEPKPAVVPALRWGDEPMEVPAKPVGSGHSSPAEPAVMELDESDASETDKSKMSRGQKRRLKRKEKGVEEKGKEESNVNAERKPEGSEPVKRVSGVAKGKAVETAIVQRMLAADVPAMTYEEFFAVCPSVAREFADMIRVKEVPVAELERRSKEVAEKLLGKELVDLDDVMLLQQDVAVESKEVAVPVYAVARCKVVAVCPRFKSIVLCGKFRVFNVLIDSGSQISGLRYGLYLGMADECPVVTGAQVSTRSAHNDVQKLKGLAHVPCDIYSIEAVLPFFLVRDEVCPYDVLLGQNVIDYLKMRFDHDSEGNYWCLMTSPVSGEEVRVMVTNADHYDNQYDVASLVRARAARAEAESQFLELQ
ncbi:hypothetical protein BCR33DRAFT_732305 [Rhizoclosmatium globosum]|uniref:Uncharacterized protein n=1 Tax=Rhizoclosmatium globosum TaxID=329046 RepID=A0A1Y1ZHH8_9FUNG|nr:hypothetical protein BCR33DRAFT_732305 [Rhizoclosmatium globosum]|eukprot:ORY09265.1 hypothetical protein BCR33DRAFT_732305 [Rhizoclosmatium globosum]